MSIFEEDAIIADVHALYEDDLLPKQEEINQKIFQTAGLTPHQMQRKLSLVEIPHDITIVERYREVFTR